MPPSASIPASGDRPASEPRYTVRALWDVRVPVSDGLELSANLWLPVAREGAPDERFPAVLEMIPYRKDDWRLSGDIARGTYLAERGFALCRLDIRGTGSSPGIALDEYTARETQDGYEAVEWLAVQPWCNGNVAMWGISYGGFTAIQVAKLRPPHLRAIVPMYATDDRYTDDVHYVGGCVTASELSQYAVSMVGMNALPPTPPETDDGWLADWRRRLERTPVWLYEWLQRQTDGPYWRQGSLAPDYETFTTPMLLFGGWMDGYIDPALRMMARCVNAPRRAIVGNWVHAFPDGAYPGPNLDWLHEMVRFLDHWLKGEPNGVMDEPALVWYRREWATPEPLPGAWPGEWRAEGSFPVAGAGERVLHLSGGSRPLDGRLTPEPEAGPGADRFPHRATIGTRAALSWGGGGPPNGLSRDQRPDEALLPTYTGEPLVEPIDILGDPEVVLFWESPAPVATAVVRLSDVAPDGTPSQVSVGVLNLTHRRSHVEPAPLEPGRVEEVRVRLRAAGYRFRPGHRVRLSIASAYWPVIWPSPHEAVYALHRGGPHAARLVLPTVPPEGSRAVPAFRTTPPELRAIGESRDEPPEWRVIEDVLAGTVTVTTNDAGEVALPDGTSLFAGERHVLSASDASPAEARMDSEVRYRLERAGRRIVIDADGALWSTASDFRWDIELRVALDGAPFFERSWSETIPRRLV